MYITSLHTKVTKDNEELPCYQNVVVMHQFVKRPNFTEPMPKASVKLYPLLCQENQKFFKLIFTQTHNLELPL